MHPLNEAFSPALPLSPVHWLIADTTRAVTDDVPLDLAFFEALNDARSCDYP